MKSSENRLHLEHIPSVAELANSSENELLLAMSRMRHPCVRKRFIDHVQNAHELHAKKYPGYSPPTRETMEKEFEERIANALFFTEVDYKDEDPGSHQPVHLGWNLGDGNKISVSDRSLFEAHEKGHEVRMDGLPFIPGVEEIPKNRDHEYFDLLFRGAVDPDAVPFPYSDEEYQTLLDTGVTKLTKEQQIERMRSYIGNGLEILERMSQLKNYFGMRGDEPFTKTHLEYAREHYTNDRFDNMSELFRAITPEREERFLELINSVGV